MKTKPYNLEAIQAGAKPVTRDGRTAFLEKVDTMRGLPAARFIAENPDGTFTGPWWVDQIGHDFDTMGGNKDVFILDEDEELKPYQLPAEDSAYFRDEAPVSKTEAKLRELYTAGFRVYVCHRHSSDAAVIRSSPSFDQSTGVFLFVDGMSSIAKGSIKIEWTDIVWKHGFVTEDVAPINTNHAQNCLCTFIPRYTPSGLMREYGIKYAGGLRNLLVKHKSEEAKEIIDLPAYSGTGPRTGLIQMGASHVLNVVFVDTLDKKV